MPHVQPVKGRWYRDVAGGRRLQVTWVDDEETLVEARFEDGHSEQFPLAAWHDLRLQPQDADELSNDDYRRASEWADKSPDDFPEG